MPKSKSKSSAPAARLRGLPKHPALGAPDCMLKCRMGSEEAMRLPDEYGAPTAATNLPDDILITPNANGDFVLTIHYSLGHYIHTVTAGTCAASDTKVSTGRYTGFTNAASVARTVCTKVSILYIGSEMNAAGYISVSRKYDVTDVYGKTMSDLHGLAERQVRAQEGLTTYLAPQQTPRFEAPAANSFMAATSPCLVIAGSGLPVAQVIKVRVLRFMEFVPKEGDLFEGETSIEPYNDGALKANAQLASPQLSMHTEAERPSWPSKVAAAANAAYHIAQPFAQYLVPAATKYLKGVAAEAFAASPMLMLGM